MTGTPAVLALDQGTTGSTALVVARDGRILGRAYSEFPQHFPRPGWVEHDAEDIWETTRKVGLGAQEEARNRERVQILSVGITNQRETVVLWDRETLEPVHRAIVWQDRRTGGICRELEEGGHLAEVRERTGLLLDPYFSGTKLTWVFRERPDLRSRAEAGELVAGTVDAWLIARLTGGRVEATDPTNASRTLLYDIQERRWHPDLLTLFEVPEGILPEVRPSSGDFGTTLAEAIGVEVPVSGVAGDQQAALFGQGCWERGLAKNTYGTGAFLLLHTGGEVVASEHGLVTTVACGPSGEPQYALEGSIFVAGAAVQWLRDGLGLLKTAADSEAMARSLSSNEGVYMVPAFVGLGAPHWKPDARGVLTGLTRGTRPEHLVRAALEAMAYSTSDVLTAMEADSGVEAEELRVDGAASKNDWLMEFQSGILDLPVRRPAVVETTALGAAGLAGLGSGVWKDADEFLEAQGRPRFFRSRMGEKERTDLLGGWNRALAAAEAAVGSGGSS